MWKYLRSAWQCNQTLRYQAKSDYRWRFSQETATKTRVRTSPKTWLEPPWFRTMALQFVCVHYTDVDPKPRPGTGQGQGQGEGAPRREPEGAPGEKGERRGASAPERKSERERPPQARAPGDSDPAQGGERVDRAARDPGRQQNRNSQNPSCCTTTLTLPSHPSHFSK